MIKYRLGCDQNHEFEAWFGSIAQFDAQAAARQVACPLCGSSAIEKVPVAPALAKHRTDRRAPDRAETHQPLSSMAPDVAHAGRREIVDELRRLRAKLLQGSENVGSEFAEEARKIHFGEAPERAVHGEATLGEAMKLAEDGVPFGLVPKLPETHN